MYNSNPSNASSRFCDILSPLEHCFCSNCQALRCWASPARPER